MARAAAVLADSIDDVGGSGGDAATLATPTPTPVALEDLEPVLDNVLSLWEAEGTLAKRYIKDLRRELAERLRVPEDTFRVEPLRTQVWSMLAGKLKALDSDQPWAAAGSDAFAAGSGDRVPLRVQARAVIHTISPNIPILLAGSASSRKSSLCERTTDFLKGGDITADCYLTDATLAGIRTCIVNHNRCSATSDELVNTFATPWSDQGSGVHYLSRAKLNTYSQCATPSCKNVGVSCGFLRRQTKLRLSVRLFRKRRVLCCVAARLGN